MQHDRDEAGLHLARGHSYTLAYALEFAAWFHHFRREDQRTLEFAEAATGLSQEQGFMGGEIMRPGLLALLAEAYAKTGRSKEALAALTEALALAEKSGERHYPAELYRLKGKTLLASPAESQAEAEACIHQAVAISRRQSAKSWELRAVMSLNRLYQKQGKQAEARRMLAEVYGWFTEGFDTPDLVDAAALLNSLA